MWWKVTEELLNTHMHACNESNLWGSANITSKDWLHIPKSHGSDLLEQLNNWYIEIKKLSGAIALGMMLVG